MASTRKARKKSVPPAPAGGPRPAKAAARAEAAGAWIGAGRRERLLVAAILAAGFLAFANSLGGEFAYDDRFQVLRNPTIRELSNIPKMFVQSVWQFIDQGADSIGAYYRPLFNVALIVNYNLFGLNVTGWHVVSVLFHLGVTLLVYGLARQWQLSREVAGAAALLFAVHPAHVESVAWISGIPDPMAGVFLLAALIFYDRYHRQAGKKWLLWAGVAMAALAMLSKETSIVLPALLVAFEWFERPAGEALSETVKRMTRRVAPFAAVAALYLLARYLVLGFINQTDPRAAGVSTLSMLMTIPSVLMAYARMLFAPYPLAIVYDQTFVQSPGDPRFWGALLAVGALLGLAAWAVRGSAAGRRALTLAVLFILPVLNLKAFSPLESLLHDRYLYLPSVGFCMLIAMGVAHLVARFAGGRQPVYAAAVLAMALPLFALTVNQNRTWASDFAMASHAARLFPNWPFLHNYIGAHYSVQNQLSEAEAAYRRAIELKPDYFDAHSNLGDVYLKQGRWADAEGPYLKAIETGAPYSQTQYNLGVVYTNLGRYAEAERHLLRAVEIQPTLAEAQYNLGWVYQRQNKLAEAERAYLNALAARQTYVEPRNNLAALLNQQGRLQEAQAQLEYLRRIAPNDMAATYTLGDVYQKQGRYQDAINLFNQIVARDPQNRYVYANLGTCYEKLGNVEQAKANYRRAIEVAPQDPQADYARQRLAALP